MEINNIIIIRFLLKKIIKDKNSHKSNIKELSG